MEDGWIICCSMTFDNSHFVDNSLNDNLQLRRLFKKSYIDLKKKEKEDLKNDKGIHCFMII